MSNDSEMKPFSVDLLEIMILQRDFATSVVRKRERSPIRLIRSGLRSAGETLAQLLDRRSTTLLAAGLSIVLGGMLAFMPHQGKTPSINPEGQKVEFVRETDSANPVVIESEANLAILNPGPIVRGVGSTPEVSESFALRIGSFRDPSNADRVVKSLQEHNIDGRTELANGLYVVVLGPISQRTEAENAAHSVQETIGLIPQILINTFK
jgi:hypothetical protein